MPFDESQPEPSTEPDTENSTIFHAVDKSVNYPSEKRLDGFSTFAQHYGRLAKLNTGVYNGKWSVDESEQWRREGLAVFDSIASRLELTPFQKTTGRQQMDNIDASELSSPNGIDTTLIAIIVCAIVSRKDGRTYHPNRGDETNDPLFTNLLAEFGYRDRVVRSCYAKVLDRVVL